MIVSSLLVISTVMADLLCAMVPMSFHLRHKRKHAFMLSFPTQRDPRWAQNTARLWQHLLVEHNGSAVSVLDEHSNERDADEDIVGVIVLHEKNIDKSSYREECLVIFHPPTLAGKVSWPKPSSFSTSLMYSSSASAACIRLESKEPR